MQIFSGSEPRRQRKKYLKERMNNSSSVWGKKVEKYTLHLNNKDVFGDLGQNNSISGWTQSQSMAG